MYIYLHKYLVLLFQAETFACSSDVVKQKVTSILQQTTAAGCYTRHSKLICIWNFWKIHLKLRLPANFCCQMSCWCMPPLNCNSHFFSGEKITSGSSHFRGKTCTKAQNDFFSWILVRFNFWFSNKLIFVFYCYKSMRIYLLLTVKCLFTYKPGVNIGQAGETKDTKYCFRHVRWCLHLRVLIILIAVTTVLPGSSKILNLANGHWLVSRWLMNHFQTKWFFIQNLSLNSEFSLSKAWPWLDRSLQVYFQKVHTWSVRCWSLWVQLILESVVMDVRYFFRSWMCYSFYNKDRMQVYSTIIIIIIKLLV